MYENKPYGPGGVAPTVVRNGASILDRGMPTETGTVRSPSGTRGLAVTGLGANSWLPVDLGPNHGHPSPPQLPTYLTRS